MLKHEPLLTRQGTFVVGANYWASHAGTLMWDDWRPDVIEKDLKLLAEHGMEILRVFPLWPAFQPIRRMLKTGRIHLENQQLPDSPSSQAGVSEMMMARFAKFLDLAQSCNIKLIVALLTGWMSGRLHVPPALEGMNVLTDPAAVVWEVRFVKFFVGAMKIHRSIIAWDLGNECNCMARCSRDAAWAWTATITHAIRSEDPDRPVVSGMHSLSPNGEWTIQDQGELTDLLTTHPYPIFTPYCDLDPINTMRSCLHSTAESRYYADIGAKPCLVEELGTLGAMISSRQAAADYVRTVLWSLWAHDCHGLLWWCAFDQAHLAHAPYDWNAVERELGLFEPDCKPKPVVDEMLNFSRFLKGLPIGDLPARRAEAVCILSPQQDTWAAGLASFILAKQAGFDLTFQYSDQPLRDAKLYLLPSIKGDPITRRSWLELLERIRAGASLYVSLDEGFLSPFNECFGLEVQTRQRRGKPQLVTMEGIAGRPGITLLAPLRLNLRACGAQVLGRECDGNPALTCFEFGKGKTYFLTFPMEKNLSAAPGVFYTDDAEPAWRIYQHFAADASASRAVCKNAPQLGVTEHDLDDHRRLIIAINYSPASLQTALDLKESWTLESCWRGMVQPHKDRQIWLSMGQNDGAAFVLSR